MLCLLSAGLGGYINSINGDVGKLATTFEEYMSEMTTSVDAVSANLTGMETAIAGEMEKLGRRVAGAETAGGSVAGSRRCRRSEMSAKS